jgi:hypothetical protein
MKNVPVKQTEWLSFYSNVFIKVTMRKRDIEREKRRKANTCVPFFYLEIYLCNISVYDGL